MTLLMLLWLTKIQIYDANKEISNNITMHVVPTFLLLQVAPPGD